MKWNISRWSALSLVVGLVLTILASLEVKQAIEQDAKEGFAFTGDQVTLKIQERLDAYALILKGGAGLFAASDSVSHREWQDYVEKLRSQDSVPGVQGIGFSQVIPPHQLAAHTAKVRAEGFPDYTVRPAGERTLYQCLYRRNQRPSLGFVNASITDSARIFTDVAGRLLTKRGRDRAQ